MFVQSELTPNPNSIKFLPGKTVSKSGSFEVTKKDETNNELIKNLFSVSGVESIFLGKDFISVNKQDEVEWEEIKHIIISLINDFYSTGKECVIEKSLDESLENLEEIEKKEEWRERETRTKNQKLKPKSTNTRNLSRVVFSPSIF